MSEENEEISTSQISQIANILKRHLEDHTQNVSLILFILGKGFPKGDDCLKCCDNCSQTNCSEPKRRKKIKNQLNNLYNHALFPEELKLNYPSTEEQIVFQDSEVDLIILLPESFGSTSEFSLYMEDSRIAPKLRIFVPIQFHPLEGSTSSYLTDVYLRFLTQYGHVYPFNDDQDLFNKIEKLTESYKRVLYLKRNTS